MEEGSGGELSRVADTVERVRPGMAGDLLGHAADMLADDRVTSARLRHRPAEMRTAPAGVLRTAESRGARLRDSHGHGPGPEL